VGLRHLEEAAKVAQVKVNLTWEPFFLNKNTPEEGEDLEEYLSRKYGASAVQRLHDPNSYMRTAGRKVGIEFNSKRRVLPTGKAHALMEYAKERQGNDTANKIMEDLFHRYFEKAENISDVNLLVDIASKHGIDKESAKNAIQDDKFIYAVNEKDQLHKQQMRISGVPFFVIQRKDGKRPVGFSGAQPVDVIAEQLEDATQE
jgi:predicted DsbA family dithiol-disulfide isomerase